MSSPDDASRHIYSSASDTKLDVCSWDRDNLGRLAYTSREYLEPSRTWVIVLSFDIESIKQGQRPLPWMEDSVV